MFKKGWVFPPSVVSDSAECADCMGYPPRLGGAPLIRVREVPERLISSLRPCAMGGHRVSVIVVVVLVVLAGGSRRVAGSHGSTGSHGIPRDPMGPMGPMGPMSPMGSHVIIHSS